MFYVRLEPQTFGSTEQRFTNDATTRRCKGCSIDGI